MVIWTSLVTEIRTTRAGRILHWNRIERMRGKEVMEGDWRLVLFGKFHLKMI